MNSVKMLFAYSNSQADFYCRHMKYTSYLKYFPLIVPVIALLGVFVFYQYYLNEYVANFSENFRTQNSSELANHDLLGLSTRLNSLSSSENIVCVSAENEGHLFFQFKKTGMDCSERFFNRKIVIGSNNANKFRIRILLTLPQEARLGFYVYGFIQLMLIGLMGYMIQRIEKIKHANNVRVANISKQVSHDIRSPLSSLVSISHQLNIDQKLNSVLKDSIQRIIDIVDKIDKCNDHKKVDKVNVRLVSLLNKICHEKRVEFINDSIEVKLDVTSNDISLASQVVPSELSTIISNLVNNSIEAGANFVEVSLSEEMDCNIIKVKDNGRGVDDSLKEIIFDEGKSFNKTNGNGLGLYHAREMMESWGGKIVVKSGSPGGFVVLLYLPKQEFDGVVAVPLKEGAIIVVVDDDRGVHKLLEEKFEEYKSHLSGVRFFDKFSGIDVGLFSDNVLFFVDQNIVGDDIKGFDFIKKNNLETLSLLMTHDYNNENLVNKCKSQGVSLVDKNLLPILPMRFIKPDCFKEIVLIDDDDLLTRTWKILSNDKVKVKSHKSVEEWLSHMYSYSKDVILLIDNNISGDRCGKKVATDAYVNGFKNIYLYSGEKVEIDDEMDWLKGVIFKQSDIRTVQNKVLSES